MDIDVIKHAEEKARKALEDAAIALAYYRENALEPLREQAKENGDVTTLFLSLGFCKEVVQLLDVMQEVDKSLHLLTHAAEHGIPEELLNEQEACEEG